MIRKPISKTRYFNYTFFSIVCLILVYSWLSYRQHQINSQDTTIPNLQQLIAGFHKIIDKNWLVEDAIATFTRHSLGMLIGIVISLIVGIAMGCYPAVEAIFHLPLSFFAKVPQTAMLAVYFVIFGVDFELYLAMVAFGVFPTLAQTVYQSARKDVSEHLIYKAYTLGASNAEIIFRVVCMQIMPRLIEAVRLTVGPAMVILIAAEWMMADVGFGYRLRIQSRLLNMNVVYIYLVVLGGCGFLMDWSITKIRRKLCPWFGE